MLVEIRGIELPGRRFSHFEDVQVGMRVGDAVLGLAPGDAASARWEAELQVREVDEGYDLRGPAVRGRRGERALAPAWLDGEGELFRAAKIRLDRVPGAVLAAALRDDRRLVATIRLTDAKGGPLCASVPDSHIVWEPGT